MNALEASDAASAAVQKTPNRVTLASMEAKIVREEYLHPESAPHLTICVLTVENGFMLVGKSAPADPANFDPDLGRKFARENAIREMWAHEGYLLCQKLWDSFERPTEKDAPFPDAQPTLRRLSNYIAAQPGDFDVVVVDWDTFGALRKEILPEDQIASARLNSEGFNNLVIYRKAIVPHISVPRFGVCFVTTEADFVRAHKPSEA